MKYLGWLSMMLLIACKSSIQDQVNDHVRACGTFRHEVLLIEDAQGSRYTASRRAALRVMSTEGQDRSELLTSQTCLDRPDGDAPLLITEPEQAEMMKIMGRQLERLGYARDSQLVHA